MGPTQRHDADTDEEEGERECNSTHDRQKQQTRETHTETERIGDHSADRLSLYIHEEGTGELLEVVYDADVLMVPDVGDSISFTEASAEGDLKEQAVRYRETESSPTYVVNRRDITYLHVEYDIDGVQKNSELVSEVRAWVDTIHTADDDAQ